MKAFLILLVFSAAGLAGVLYWRRALQAPPAPVVAAANDAAKSGKASKERRRRRGARRLPRTAGVGAPLPPRGAPVDDRPVGEAPAPVFAPSDDHVAGVPGAASATEVPPSDVLGSLSPSSPRAAVASGARRLPIAEPAPFRLGPGDLKVVWQGQDLARTETMRLDFSNDSGGQELSQDEIDARFRVKEDAILECVSRARPDEHTYVPGRVTVRFRILPTGAVRGVQVEAPVILHKGGLMGCVKGVVGSLRFPVSATSQVVSFPFSLL